MGARADYHLTGPQEMWKSRWRTCSKETRRPHFSGPSAVCTNPKQRPIRNRRRVTRQEFGGGRPIAQKDDVAPARLAEYCDEEDGSLFSSSPSRVTKRPHVGDGARRPQLVVRSNRPILSLNLTTDTTMHSLPRSKVQVKRDNHIERRVQERQGGQPGRPKRVRGQKEKNRDQPQDSPDVQ